ncbi:hypothetical protein K6V92_02085 [Cupriavidus respiraculi]|uniref:phage tail assembly chaperone n=1 Tax=Cupriavidus respiraculi TaxID=195930 RepID=UPI001C93EF70|nr:hypothetical protein [Cupriavidus respiraculi]MBY4945413.1 hypothetical protein [Cupriavidus respiraculi]
MSRATNVTIGDAEFMIRKMDPFLALRIFGDLQRDILPAVGHLLEGAFGGGAGTGGNAGQDATVAEAIRELSAKLDGASLEAWANRLLDPEFVAVSINGRESRLTKEMRALAFSDAGDILELMFQIIRLNFADFFLRWAGRFGSVQGLAETLSADSGATSKRSS